MNIVESKLGSRAVIKIDTDRVIGTVDPNIYGGFVEHMGRCVYGGLVDYDNKSGLVDSKGYRTDVMKALKPLDMPVVRYPGGNFTCQYHWMDGIGPKDQRPIRKEAAELPEELNLFGTDEFMDWCKDYGCEPYLCLNMGTGTLDEALAWLEYCNSNGNTYYAQLRRKNGHPEPYNVKYWGLGNEIWGSWVVGEDTPEHHAKKAWEWAKAMKKHDPSIVLIGCGQNGLNAWDRVATDKLTGKIDMYSLHYYTYHKDWYKNVTSPTAAEVGIQNIVGLLNHARITKHQMSEVKISFDEWNVWDPVQAPGEEGAEQIFTFSDAIGVACWLNVFIRQAKHVAMANIAQVVNVIGPVFTSPTGLVLQTIYYPFELFSQHMRGDSIGLHVRSPYYKGETGGLYGSLGWLSDFVDIPLLDTAATINYDRCVLTVTAVNRSFEDNIRAEVIFDVNVTGDKVKVWTLYHEDVNATNNFHEPYNVKTEESEVSYWQLKKEGYFFKKHSFTMLQFTVGKESEC